MKCLLKKKHGAFSLIEVMFAVALVSMALGVIFSFVAHLLSVTSKTKLLAHSITNTPILFHYVSPLRERKDAHQKEADQEEEVPFPLYHSFQEYRQIEGKKTPRVVAGTREEASSSNSIMSNAVFVLYPEKKKNET